MLSDDAANTSAAIDWYSTVRGRLGWTPGQQVLFYGTGGLAFGKVNLNSYFDNTGLILSSQASSTKVGWVLGGGVEYLLRPDVTLNLSYQYVDLGSVSVAAGTSDCCYIVSQSASIHAQFQVVTIGLNWKFNTPATVVAPRNIVTKAPPKTFFSMPWEGSYLGGHVGRAWGDNTNAIYSGSLFGN